MITKFHIFQLHWLLEVREFSRRWWLDQGCGLIRLRHCCKICSTKVVKIKIFLTKVVEIQSELDSLRIFKSKQERDLNSKKALKTSTKDQNTNFCITETGNAIERSQRSSTTLQNKRKPITKLHQHIIYILKGTKMYNLVSMKEMYKKSFFITERNDR